jgi:hypothetical protein
VKKQASNYDALDVIDKVTATPTLFVGKTGTKGKLVNLASAVDEASLVQAITAALSS